MKVSHLELTVKASVTRRAFLQTGTAALALSGLIKRTAALVRGDAVVFCRRYHLVRCSASAGTSLGRAFSSDTRGNRAHG